MPCSPEEDYRNFEGKHCLCCQGRKVSGTRYQKESGGKQQAVHCYLFPSGFFYALFFDFVNKDTALLRNLSGLLSVYVVLGPRKPTISLNSICLSVFGTETSYAFYTYE
jgi:hypothetical protein